MPARKYGRPPSQEQQMNNDSYSVWHSDNPKEGASYIARDFCGFFTGSFLAFSRTSYMIDISQRCPLKSCFEMIDISQRCPLKVIVRVLRCFAIIE
jgi:hypothetical protein